MFELNGGCSFVLVVVGRDFVVARRSLWHSPITVPLARERQRRRSVFVVIDVFDSSRSTAYVVKESETVTFLCVM